VWVPADRLSSLAFARPQDRWSVNKVGRICSVASQRTADRRTDCGGCSVSSREIASYEAVVEYDGHGSLGRQCETETDSTVATRARRPPVGPLADALPPLVAARRYGFPRLVHRRPAEPRVHGRTDPTARWVSGRERERRNLRRSGVRLKGFATTRAGRQGAESTERIEPIIARGRRLPESNY
jgi:hypothetical protein